MASPFSIPPLRYLSELNVGEDGDDGFAVDCDPRMLTPRKGEEFIHAALQDLLWKVRDRRGLYGDSLERLKSEIALQNEMREKYEAQLYANNTAAKIKEERLQIAIRSLQAEMTTVNSQMQVLKKERESNLNEMSSLSEQLHKVRLSESDARDLASRESEARAAAERSATVLKARMAELEQDCQSKVKTARDEAEKEGQVAKNAVDNACQLQVRLEEAELKVRLLEDEVIFTKEECRRQLELLKETSDREIAALQRQVVITKEEAGLSIEKVTMELTSTMQRELSAKDLELTHLQKDLKSALQALDSLEFERAERGTWEMSFRAQTEDALEKTKSVYAGEMHALVLNLESTQGKMKEALEELKAANSDRNRLQLEVQQNLLEWEKTKHELGISRKDTESLKGELLRTQMDLVSSQQALESTRREMTAEVERLNLQCQGLKMSLAASSDKIEVLREEIARRREKEEHLERKLESAAHEIAVEKVEVQRMNDRLIELRMEKENREKSLNEAVNMWKKKAIHDADISDHSQVKIELLEAEARQLRADVLTQSLQMSIASAAWNRKEEMALSELMMVRDRVQALNASLQRAQIRQDFLQVEVERVNGVCDELHKKYERERALKESLDSEKQQMVVEHESNVRKVTDQYEMKMKKMEMTFERQVEEEQKERNHVMTKDLQEIVSLESEVKEMRQLLHSSSDAALKHVTRIKELETQLREMTNSRNEEREIAQKDNEKMRMELAKYKETVTNVIQQHQQATDGGLRCSPACCALGGLKELCHVFITAACTRGVFATAILRSSLPWNPDESSDTNVHDSIWLHRAHAACIFLQSLIIQQQNKFVGSRVLADMSSMSPITISASPSADASASLRVSMSSRPPSSTTATPQRLLPSSSSSPTVLGPSFSNTRRSLEASFRNPASLPWPVDTAKWNSGTQTEEQHATAAAANNRVSFNLDPSVIPPPLHAPVPTTTTTAATTTSNVPSPVTWFSDLLGKVGISTFNQEADPHNIINNVDNIPSDEEVEEEEDNGNDDGNDAVSHLVISSNNQQVIQDPQSKKKVPASSFFDIKNNNNYNNRTSTTATAATTLSSSTDTSFETFLSSLHQKTESLPSKKKIVVHIK